MSRSALTQPVIVDPHLTHHILHHKNILPGVIPLEYGLGLSSAQALENWWTALVHSKALVGQQVNVQGFVLAEHFCTFPHVTKEMINDVHKLETTMLAQLKGLDELALRLQRERECKEAKLREEMRKRELCRCAQHPHPHPIHVVATRETMSYTVPNGTTLQSVQQPMQSLVQPVQTLAQQMF